MTTSTRGSAAAPRVLVKHDKPLSISAELELLRRTRQLATSSDTNSLTPSVGRPHFAHTIPHSDSSSRRFTGKRRLTVNATTGAGSAEESRLKSSSNLGKEGKSYARSTLQHKVCQDGKAKFDEDNKRCAVVQKIWLALCDACQWYRFVYGKEG